MYADYATTVSGGLPAPGTCPVLGGPTAARVVSVEHPPPRSRPAPINPRHSQDKSLHAPRGLKALPITSLPASVCGPLLSVPREKLFPLKCPSHRLPL